jgi:uncharacterized membrane protein
MRGDDDKLPQLDEGGAKRAEVFSDGILAISITLLVIEIHVPGVPGSRLASALHGLLPSYLAYALSFATIGLVWLAHHSMFLMIRQTNRGLLMLNLLLLLLVAFLPFSTAVLAQYATTGRPGAVVATELYSINMFLIGMAFLGVWTFLYAFPSLLVDGVERHRLTGPIKRSIVPPATYLLTTLIAPVTTTACFALWVGTTTYLAVGPSARNVVRLLTRGRSRVAGGN